MNGNQMALLAWWELSGVVGLSILAWVFLPIYYKNNCTTVTELLEKKYKNVGIRSTIGTIFLVGNVFIYQPITLYTGALMMKSMFGLQIPIMTVALVFAVAGSLYAIFGGLRAVAITDTFSGILLLGMCMLVVFLSLKAIGFDFSGIPHERLTMIGGNNSPLPWHVLLTGMIFIQMFYWSTNQTITQRAMAAPNLKEAQKGVVAATIVRLLIVPPMVVIPGIVSYKLFGHLGDAAYGKIVWHVLPNWMSGIFAAAIASACSRNLRPCEVSDRPSVERANRRVPSCFSSAATLRPTVGWLMRSRRAAPARLRVSATATNVLQSSQSMRRPPAPVFNSGQSAVQY